MADKDYILVRDKDGNLKYYKDGKFFALDEVKKNAAPTKEEAKKAKPLTDIKIEPVQEDPEVSQHAGREDVRGELNQVISRAAEDIMNELKVRFTDEKLKKRFEDLITTRLRGIRGDAEAHYMLTAAKDDGGFGLNDKSADLVLAVIKKHEEPLVKAKKGLAVKTFEKSEKQTTDTKQKSPQPKVQPTPIPPSRKPPVVRQEKPGVESGQSDKSDPDSGYKPLIPLPKQELTPEQIITGQKPAVKQPVRKQTSQRSEKARVGDVAFRPRLMGPVEELRTLDLQNFRRMGAEPADRVAEIKEKIDLLTEESLPQRFAGIQAWRESTVFRTYADMGVQSVMTGEPLEQVIVARQVKNEPSLTQSEFESINSLNRSLAL